MALTIPQDSNVSRICPDGESAAIELRRVTKRFHIYEHRPKSLRERFVRTASRRSRSVAKPRFRLSDVSLTVRPSETWAVVGPNGAGKSTLLRLMAGIYWPSIGEVVTRGRLAAVIELGVGFHPELTGRENVRLYWSILGLARTELTSRYREIVEFAGIEDFMDTRVKYYSSGMHLRLGFAVATAVQPDILLLDEILSVGDAEFRDRSSQRLKAFQASGCTLVFAAHDLDVAADLASQAIWLDRGRVRAQGPAKDVIAAYRRTVEPPAVAEGAVTLPAAVDVDSVVIP